MTAASRFGLGVHPTLHTAFAPDNPLSTAPASPTDDGPASKHSTMPPQQEESSTTTTSYAMPPPNATVASFSFGPAIQTTVTTVTKTTTTSLPPIVMRPPRDLHERDPRQYPLAFTPTPSPLKKFAFDYHGRPTSFFEAEDPDDTMQKYQETQDRIWRHNGAVSNVARKETYETPTRSGKSSTAGKQREHVRQVSGVKRTATPVSISEAAELASHERKTKKPRAYLERTSSETAEIASLNQASVVGISHTTSNPSPITPNTEPGVPGFPLSKAGPSRAELLRRREGARISQSRLREVRDDKDEDGDSRMVESEVQDEDSQMGPPFYGKRCKTKQGLTELSALGGADRCSGTVTMPSIQDTDAESVSRRDARRPRPPTILTSSQQDASLPSPSLSPITAAANAANRNRNTFDESFAVHNEENASVVSGLDLDNDSQSHSIVTFDSQHSIKALNGSQPNAVFGYGSTLDSKGPTIQDIPAMLDAFDCMPEDMQSWLLYQFLRRCTKPTLQVVASVVNPALKCDPFNALPPELGLNVTRFLDARSMCRAAQVSKRWRQLINSNETAWKDVLDRDGFVLPYNEIAKAVKEGWGWQNPGADGSEMDLSKELRKWVTPDPIPEMHGSVVSDDDETTSSAVPKKAKRKATGRQPGMKKTKRHASQTSSNSKYTVVAPWKNTFAAAQGPHGFATAATQAFPENMTHDSIGLPSLKGMHLFKSLYQRHYMIRKSWMMEDSQPLHLAFRAHHRHVVTCLLFDSDKILTGSDDTKINVYDTKTGALRNRLEGHEGGVWALQYEGDTLVSGSTDRSVRVWDIKTGRCLQVFQGHTSTVRCLVILQPTQIGTEQEGTPIIMPKEPLIITGSRDSTLRVWKLPQPGDPQIFQAGPPANDRDNPYFLRTLSGHHNSVRAIAAHGDTLISGSYDCSVRVWKISTGEQVHRLQGHTQKVYSVVLDHARHRCISGSMDNLVKVWDLNSGACLYNLEGHTSLVGLLDLSHDRLVSAAADSTLRIWDPEVGACKATLSAHTGAITCFQHDGQKVISGSDRTLKMWNVRNGEFVRDLLVDLSGVWQVRFDERRCVAAVQRNNLTYIEVRKPIEYWMGGFNMLMSCNRSSILAPHAMGLRQRSGAVASWSISTAERSKTSRSRLRRILMPALDLFITLPPAESSYHRCTLVNHHSLRYSEDIAFYSSCYNNTFFFSDKHDFEQRV